MDRILIIGQAPPFQKQKYPYDTTLLYEWLNECGVSKEAAQDLFIFEAMTNTFPGFDVKGGHKKPTTNEMDSHMSEVLIPYMKNTKKVICLGNVPRDYFNANASYIQEHCGKVSVIFLIHPSKRNYALYQRNKEVIISKLKSFIK
ncbi:MAG: Phi17:2 [Segetibacter sp.]|nr:Phi17:2 [Segetibacter sp.]